MNEELWKQWSDCHQSPDQQKRISSAAKAACTPIELDSDSGTGTFKGSSGTHTTSLEKCSCIDFNRRKLPCKHMYRLAMELGLLDVSHKSDLNEVADASSPRIPISKTVEIIESLTESQQHLLHNIVSRMNSKNSTSVVEITSDLLVLLDAQLFSRSDELTTVLSGYKIAELRNLLLSFGSGFKASRKADIINHLVENYSDKLETMDIRYTAVHLLSRIKYGKVNMYLHRKFDTESIWQPEDNFVELPLLKTALPHDDVTDLLIKYGYYDPDSIDDTTYFR